MIRGKLALITSAVLLLGAGVVIGRLTSRIPAADANPSRSGQGPSWIAQQLNLSADQRSRMDAIWADTRQKMDQTFEKRHDMDHQRDAAIAAILSDSQKAAYDKITADYRQQRADLEKQRQSLFADAEKRTRELLDPTQQQKYDELTKQMHNHHGPWHSGPSSETQPATQPGASN